MDVEAAFAKQVRDAEKYGFQEGEDRELQPCEYDEREFLAIGEEFAECILGLQELTRDIGKMEVESGNRQSLRMDFEAKIGSRV